MSTGNIGHPLRSRYDDLVSIATDLFSEHGYERTTVRMIADRMGIKSGSLYSHISSKEEILFEIISYIATAICERAEIVPRTLPPEERIRELARTHFRTLHDYKASVDVYFREWRKLSSERQARIIELRSRYERLYIDSIVEGVRDGTFGDIQVSRALYVLLGALNWAYQWYQPDGPLGPEELADDLLDVTLTGLLARHTADADGR